jgi:hypothetical protein
VKIILFIVFILMICAYGCQRGISKEKNIPSTSLYGSWELRQQQSGMIPVVAYPAGNGTGLLFTKDSFETRINGNLVQSGTYTLVEDPDVQTEVGLTFPAGRFNRRIVFKDSTTAKIYLDISNDTLTLVSGYFPTDGGSMRIYVRQQ